MFSRQTMPLRTGAVVVIRPASSGQLRQQQGDKPGVLLIAQFVSSHAGSPHTVCQRGLDIVRYFDQDLCIDVDVVSGDEIRRQVLLLKIRIYLCKDHERSPRLIKSCPYRLSTSDCCIEATGEAYGSGIGYGFTHSNNHWTGIEQDFRVFQCLTGV